MGRLRQLPPRVAALPPRLARLTDAEGHSVALEPWRAWYKTTEWQALRRRVFLRDGYRCRMCAKPDARPIGDHIEPHRGDRRRFFDDDNVQTLCKPCHDGPKQRIERRRG